MRDTYIENKLHILLSGRSLIAQKGFASVGLSEILSAAAIPKGSFYHYFGSKEQYGLELIEHYVTEYLQSLDHILAQPGSARQRLLDYWGDGLETQSCQAAEHKCLVVKLSAEVADLSDAMRLALHQGTQSFMQRISRLIGAGIAEGSLSSALEPVHTAQMLYQLWLGASLLNKLSRDRQPLEAAMEVTLEVLAAP